MSEPKYGLFDDRSATGISLEYGRSYRNLDSGTVRSCMRRSPAFTEFNIVSTSSPAGSRGRNFITSSLFIVLNRLTSSARGWLDSADAWALEPVFSTPVSASLRTSSHIDTQSIVVDSSDTSVELLYTAIVNAVQYFAHRPHTNIPLFCSSDKLRKQLWH